MTAISNGVAGPQYRHIQLIINYIWAILKYYIPSVRGYRDGGRSVVHSRHGGENRQWHRVRNLPVQRALTCVLHCLVSSSYPECHFRNACVFLLKNKKKNDDINNDNNNHHLHHHHHHHHHYYYYYYYYYLQAKPSMVNWGKRNDGNAIVNGRGDVAVKTETSQWAKLGSLLFGPIDGQYPESVYTEINGEMVRQTALRTKGAGGPSWVNANGFRRILACKSFKQSSTRLCKAIATITWTLCSQSIDPMTIEPLVANRLISLDKGEGAVRPIWVGEV